LQSYRYAYDRQGYSQAFWELRNVILQKYLSPFIVGVMVFSLAQSIFQRLERRKRWLDPVRAWLNGLLRYKWVDDFVFLFRFIKQPADSFYYIKKSLRGSLRFAFVLYAWVVIARILSLYLTAFPFNSYPSPAFIRVENEILYTVGLIFLWNAANYLVSTISDGEGRVRDVVIGCSHRYGVQFVPLRTVFTAHCLAFECSDPERGVHFHLLHAAHVCLGRVNALSDGQGNSQLLVL